eukprot:6673752-Ditylum_brightwellii.AAC.1
MATSIEALFILMGFPEPHRRRNDVCMEKFLAAMCSYEKKQLGIRINTRDMAVGMMLMKLTAIITEIQYWHKKRKSFNIRQVLLLLHSVVIALTGNSVSLKSVSTRYKKLKPCIKSKKISSDDELRAHFAQSHTAK